MKFIVSQELKKQLLSSFEENSFENSIYDLEQTKIFKVRTLTYLVIEDIVIQDLQLIHSLYNKHPSLKIIFYYDPSKIPLEKVLSLPVALPFSKIQKFQKFYEFLLILKKRQAENPVSRNLFKAGIFLDVDQRLLTKDFKQIRLSEMEFKLLHSLMLRHGRVVSKETLLDEVWNYHLFSNSKTLEVHISRLRKALKKNFNISPIKTIYKTGYMFEL